MDQIGYLFRQALNESQPGPVSGYLRHGYNPDPADQIHVGSGFGYKTNSCSYNLKGRIYTFP